MDTEAIVESARVPTLNAMERLRQRDKVASTYSLVLDREWAKAHMDACLELERAKRGDNFEEIAAAELAKAELAGQREGAVLEFQFRHCSPVRYETLMSDHRPTEKMREETKGQPLSAQPRWAPTFRPAFIMETLISPILIAEEIEELFDPPPELAAILSPAEAAELFMAALMASNSVTRFELDSP